MRKRIKQWGNSAVIVLNSEDLKVYNLSIGDSVDISDIVRVNYRKLPKNQTKENIKEVIMHGGNN